MNAISTGDYAVSTEGFCVDPYAIVIPKDDAEFKKIIDGVLMGLFKSGRCKTIPTLAKLCASRTSA